MEGSSDSQVGNRSLHCTPTVLVCISRTAFTIFIRLYFSDFCNEDVSLCVVGAPEAVEVTAAACWPLPGVTAVFTGGAVRAGRGISSHPLEKETYVPKR